MSGNRLRICLFTPSFLPKVGGMEVVVDCLARQYQQAGHDVVVVSKAMDPGEAPPALPYEVIRYRKTRSATWFLGPQKRTLIKQHRRMPFDVIHAHMAYPSGYVAVGAGRRLGVPVVITSHMGDIGPNGRYRQRFLTRRRMIWAMQNAAAVTGVSIALKGIIDELTAGAARSRVIPNGVDLPPSPPAQAPADLSDLASRPFMLTLGRLHRSKALDVLLEAVAMLRRRGVELPYLVIAGDGKIRTQLEAQAGELGLKEAVRFVGLRQGQEKNWLLHACRFFVQPSIIEGMPLTVLEAMAAGKCVMGTDIGGTNELIQHGHNGVLARPGDAAAYADALTELSQRANRQGLADMESAARAMAQKFLWPAIAQEYLRLFRSL